MTENNSQNNTNGSSELFVDHTNEFTKEQKDSGKLMGVLSYLSILSLIPYFTEKNNPYVKFHAKQGVNMFIFEAILGFFSGFGGILLGFIGFVAYLCLVAFFILSIIGIVNVLTGEAKEFAFLRKILIVK